MERGESRTAAAASGSSGDSSANDANAEAGLEAKLCKLVSLLRRQSLSILWSRSPLLSHNAGHDFPIIDPRSAVGAHELSHPTMRLRLRRHAEPAATLAHAAASAPAATGALQLAFQAMLDAATPAAGSSSAEPPLRCDMLLYADGVRAA